MAHFFPDDIIEEVKTANGIYEVISEFIPLKKSGHSYRGLCPFHSEKTPSFFVVPDKQIFHCFGCGAGGNVFTFLMQYENMTFPEAVKQLAARRGIILPEIERRIDREESLKKQILAHNEKAARFFQQQLAGAAGEAARRYLTGRGIGEEGIKRFRLGWSPAGWEHLREHLKKDGVKDEEMAKAGLIVQRQGGDGYYDRFRGRLMFPIANTQGEIVAFGGRVLGSEGEPKYMNSPETPVYQKSKVLYGLNAARTKIREAGYAAVVEGYLDLIMAHLSGAENTVATLGTALTREHLRLLKRHSGKVVLIYDGDAAGIEATKRSLELFLEEEMTVNTTTLPEGHDPDSLIRAKGAEAFRDALRQSTPLLDFFIRKTADKWKHEGIEGKARAVEEIVPLLAKIVNRIKQSEYSRKVAQVLDVREEALSAELKAHQGGQGRKRAPAAPGPARPRCFEEEELVRGLLLSPGLAGRIREEVPLALYRDEDCRSVATAVYEAMDRGKGDVQTVAAGLESRGAASLAAKLLAEPDRADNLDRVVSDCLARVRRSGMQRELKEIQEKIRQAESQNQPEIVNELLKIKQSIARA